MNLSDYSRIIVTGGTGWLGNRIVHALTAGLEDLGTFGRGGRQVRCMALAGEHTNELLKLGAEIVVGSLLDVDTVESLLKDGDGALVIHTAGVIHPPGRTKYFHEVNVKGTANLLAAAKRYGVRRLSVMSSNSPLGGNDSPNDIFTEASPYKPYMEYGKSKWHMELLLGEAIRENTWPEITIFRAPWFYGPGQPIRQTTFFRMVRDGRFPLLGGGTNKRSMCYVDSLVLGILLGSTSEEAAGQTYWIADNHPYTMLEIINTIKVVLREDFGMPVSSMNLCLPSVVGNMARLCDAALQGLGFYNQKIHVLSEMNMTIACSIEKAKTKLGYQPIVDLREGMRRSVQWCLKNGIRI